MIACRTDFIAKNPCNPPQIKHVHALSSLSISTWMPISFLSSLEEKVSDGAKVPQFEHLWLHPGLLVDSQTTIKMSSSRVREAKKRAKFRNCMGVVSITHQSITDSAANHHRNSLKHAKTDFIWKWQNSSSYTYCKEPTNDIQKVSPKDVK